MYTVYTYAHLWEEKKKKKKKKNCRKPIPEKERNRNRLASKQRICFAPVKHIVEYEDSKQYSDGRTLLPSPTAQS